MDNIMLILTIIGTCATVISTVLAIRAKNEAREILKEIKEEKNRNINNIIRKKLILRIQALIVV